MSKRTVYIISYQSATDDRGRYKTNKTNVTALWSVVTDVFGDKELVIRYQDQNQEYIQIPARSHKVKKICQEALDNRIIIKEEHSTGEKLMIYQDVLGGN